MATSPRTAALAAYSHVRRVVSPLARSQPHFEARDLHPTQWGRLCPNETPEGPNCGLVKNMALTTEVSEGAEGEDIRHSLYDLGVEPLEVSEVTGGDDE
jgi:DNA-directed RNA polymerase beta subunit